MVFILKPLAILAATVTLVTGACVTPKQRKEWRQLTTLQRKQWLDAVKVNPLLQSHGHPR
jgi:hypothetical protein